MSTMINEERIHINCEDCDFSHKEYFSDEGYPTLIQFVKDMSNLHRLTCHKMTVTLTFEIEYGKIENKVPWI